MERRDTFQNSDVFYQRAIEQGFAPTTTPEHAPWGERYFHISDPDGHELSFARPIERPCTG